jgi:hypothetical protein
MKIEDQTLPAPPAADHIREALLALDELNAAGRELKAAQIRGGDAVAPALTRWDTARRTMRILQQECDEIEGAAA